MDRKIDHAGHLDGKFRDYAWKYFELHAEQRLKMFQFYISLSTAILGGWFLLLRYGQYHRWMAILGFLLSFLTFIFWKLDDRTRMLVKNAEQALNFLDQEELTSPENGARHSLALFARDDDYTSQAPRFPLLTGHFSYRRCFNWVFVAFAAVGLAIGIGCLIYLPSADPVNPNTPSAPSIAAPTVGGT